MRCYYGCSLAVTKQKERCVTDKTQGKLDDEECRSWILCQGNDMNYFGVIFTDRIRNRRISTYIT
jgi:hypothetical protein